MSDYGGFRLAESILGSSSHSPEPGAMSIALIEASIRAVSSIHQSEWPSDGNPFGECPECLKAICNSSGADRSHCRTCDRRAQQSHG